MTDEFRVELKPHVGEKKTPRGPIPVDLGQDRVYLNGVQVGLIGRQPRAPLCTIVRFDELTLARLREEVERLRDEKITVVSQPPERPDEEEQEDDDFESLDVKDYDAGL